MLAWLVGLFFISVLKRWRSKFKKIPWFVKHCGIYVHSFILIQYPVFVWFFFQKVSCRNMKFRWNLSKVLESKTKEKLNPALCSQVPPTADLDIEQTHKQKKKNKTKEKLDTALCSQVPLTADLDIEQTHKQKTEEKQNKRKAVLCALCWLGRWTNK